jgi:hypothetical protein
MQNIFKMKNEDFIKWINSPEGDKVLDDIANEINNGDIEKETVKKDDEE